MNGESHKFKSGETLLLVGCMQIYWCLYKKWNSTVYCLGLLVIYRAYTKEWCGFKSE
jgi:hypothetical protein